MIAQSLMAIVLMSGTIGLMLGYLLAALLCGRWPDHDSDHRQDGGGDEWHEDRGHIQRRRD